MKRRKSMKSMLSKVTLTSVSIATVLMVPVNAFAERNTVVVPTPVVHQVAAHYTKQINYFKLGDPRIPGGANSKYSADWITPDNYTSQSALSNNRVLPFDMPDSVLEATGLGSEVDMAFKDANGAYWVVVNPKGLVRIDFGASDANDVFQYLTGSRYIFDATSDDKNTITGIMSDGDHGIWIQNSQGATHVKFVLQTLAEQAANMEYTRGLFDSQGAIGDQSGLTLDYGNDTSDNGPGYVSTLPTSPRVGGTNYFQDASGRTYAETLRPTNNFAYWSGFNSIGEGARYDYLANMPNPTLNDVMAKQEARSNIIRTASMAMLLTKINGLNNGSPSRSFNEIGTTNLTGRNSYNFAKAPENTDASKIQIGDVYSFGRNYDFDRKEDPIQWYPYTRFFGNGLPIHQYNPELAANNGLTDEQSPGTPDTNAFVRNNDALAPWQGYKDVAQGNLSQGNDAANPIGKILGPNGPYPTIGKGAHASAGITVYAEQDFNSATSIQAQEWNYKYQVTQNVSDRYPDLMAMIVSPDPVNPTRASYGGISDLALGRLITDGTTTNKGLQVYMHPSSEEPVGDFAQYFTLYHYVLKPELANPNTPANIREQDEKLLALLRDSATVELNTIIDSGYMLIDPNGQNSSWAKWSADNFNNDRGPNEYSNNDGIQQNMFFADASLNAAEITMFIRVTMEILEDVKTDTTDVDVLHDMDAWVTRFGAPAQEHNYAYFYNKFAAEYNKIFTGTNYAMNGYVLPAFSPLHTAFDESTTVDLFGNPVPKAAIRNGSGYISFMQNVKALKDKEAQMWIKDNNWFIKAATGALQVNDDTSVLEYIESLPPAEKNNYYLNSMLIFGNLEPLYGDPLNDTGDDLRKLVTMSQIQIDFFNQLTNKKAMRLSFNHSDAMMMFEIYYPLAMAAKNDPQYPAIQAAYGNVYNTVLINSDIPAYTYLQKIMNPNDPKIDEQVKHDTWMLSRIPQYGNGNMVTNNYANREDYFFSGAGEDMLMGHAPVSNRVLPLDERGSFKYNSVQTEDDRNAEFVEDHDIVTPFASGWNGAQTNHVKSNNFGLLYDPSIYTTGYWIAVDSGIITDAAPVNQIQAPYSVMPTFAATSASYGADGSAPAAIDVNSGRGSTGATYVSSITATTDAGTQTLISGTDFTTAFTAPQYFVSKNGLLKINLEPSTIQALSSDGTKPVTLKIVLGGASGVIGYVTLSNNN
ncbi:hypothetical protein [Paenibacillus lignilyticus]|uniref:Dextransucrase n=1 Tax=Paenibacillus lignilyticus TaxID=1172615 RepID=A0ABS5C9A9_9BACL|nr:hypothetical protein [Paenibacillus lignilyticus]MBP3962560.1 hypothetical protein [Paenibacillus lignilyticus]